MREESCCFTGPRPERLPDGGRESSPEILSLKEAIGAAVERAAADGYRYFYTGMADGFDLFAAEEVLRRREALGIYLIAAVPYLGFESSSGPDGRRARILAQADVVSYLSKTYSEACFRRRNVYMVEHSRRIIGWYNGLSGGTAHCWRRALAQGLEMVNLYPNSQEG
ncbi:MAG TPA: SLOG family protein [Oscillospiraceae bacterium]|nr:DUF1273 family protein [Oscillospiraceae bacterium]HNW04630.1 SLOG family protein [Oscillospiraceae bacterium]HPW00413.1 SLOG family protein [Oscillospiraceae bacterium]